MYYDGLGGTGRRTAALFLHLGHGINHRGQLDLVALPHPGQRKPRQNL
jgi:hypothetical protein